MDFIFFVCGIFSVALFDSSVAAPYNSSSRLTPHKHLSSSSSASDSDADPDVKATVAFCTSYCDVYGYYKPQKYCLNEDGGPIYCCGSEYNRYCCQDASKDIGADYPNVKKCPYSTYWGYQWPILIGLLGSLIAMISLAACCYYCHGSNAVERGRRNQIAAARRRRIEVTDSEGNRVELGPVDEIIRQFDPESQYAFSPPDYDLPKDPPKYSDICGEGHEGEEGVQNEAFQNEEGTGVEGRVDDDGTGVEGRVDVIRRGDTSDAVEEIEMGVMSSSTSSSTRLSSSSERTEDSPSLPPSSSFSSAASDRTNDSTSSQNQTHNSTDATPNEAAESVATTIASNCSNTNTISVDSANNDNPDNNTISVDSSNNENPNNNTISVDGANNDNPETDINTQTTSSSMNTSSRSVTSLQVTPERNGSDFSQVEV